MAKDLTSKGAPDAKRRAERDQQRMNNRAQSDGREHGPKWNVAEGNMPQSVIKSKQKYADMTAQEFHAAHQNKSEEELKSMAWRHGYGKGSSHYVAKHKKGQSTMAEAKDPREYDYEGDMAKSQLRSIIANAKRAHDMLKDDTNMAEWVQSKITLAADYISTVADYMQSELKEGKMSDLDIDMQTMKDKDFETHYGKPKREYKPKLKGNQGRLDKNNSGHLDKEDFKLLRQEEVKKGLYYYVNRRKKLGISRDKDHPKAPEPQDWKDAAKTAKEEVDLSELNKDTVISYAIRANKDQDKQSTAIGKGIRNNDPKSANKASHKFSKRAAGLDRVETRLNKEDTEVAEARMSASERFSRAFDRQRAKSNASIRLTPSSIPKPAPKNDNKQFDNDAKKINDEYGPAATAALRNKSPAYHVAAMDRKDRENKLNVDRDRALAQQKVSRGEDPTLTHAGNAALKAQQQDRLKKQRLNSEEVEQIEELNKDTLYSYADKAEKDQDKQ